MTTVTPAPQTTSHRPSVADRAAHRPAEAGHRRPPRPAALTVTVLRSGRGPHLLLDGELEVTTTALLDCLVADALDRRPGDLSLDLTATSFCDVPGLNCLLATRRRVLASGGRLTLVGVAPLLRQMLQLCGAGDVIGSCR